MRWDFHHFLHIDIDDWFRGQRSWYTFFELAEDLPPGSRYLNAVQDNDDLVAALMEGSTDSTPSNPRPPLRFWTQERSDLADIKDLLLLLVATTGHHTKQPTLTRRPETAYMRYQAMERKRNTDFLNAQLGIT